MKQHNPALIEAVKQGFKVCFENRFGGVSNYQGYDYDDADTEFGDISSESVRAKISKLYMASLKFTESYEFMDWLENHGTGIETIQHPYADACNVYISLDEWRGYFIEMVEGEYPPMDKIRNRLKELHDESEEAEEHKTNKANARKEAGEDPDEEYKDFWN